MFSSVIAECRLLFGESNKKRSRVLMTTKQKIINGKAVKLKTVKCIVCGNSGIDLSLTDGNTAGSIACNANR